MADSSFTIIIEGNIGSGKSTFLDYFSKNFNNIEVINEPVDKWRNIENQNLFNLMYTDPQKWSFCFQSYVFLTMANSHKRKVDKKFKMMERSIFSANYCFAKNLKEQNLMNSLEYAVLNEWFNYIKETTLIKCDLIVYLKTDPHIVYERILSRGRKEEKEISLDYLKSINELHENWLVRSQEYLPSPVMTFDANCNLNLMQSIYKSCENYLLNK